MVVITSAANPAVKAARKLLRRHGRSRASDAFLVEGPQALREAAPFLQRLFVAASAAPQHAELIADARARGAEVLTVEDAVLAELTETVTPQGVVGVATLPAIALESVVAPGALLVVLHQVRDPGNAGTAVRTADAAGADAVILTTGSVDPRNPKAVRSSTGSLFHLPVLDDVAFSALVAKARAAGVRLVAATADATMDHTAADLGDGVALIFGNEAHGVPVSVRDACDALVRVPLHAGVRAGFRGTAESLNLAATVAVVAYEAQRQRAGGAASSAVTR